MIRTGADNNSRQARRDRREGVLRIGAALGPPEVRGEDHPRPGFRQRLDGRQRRPDAAVVGDPISVEGDVQVDAHQHTAVADPLVEQVVERVHSFEATRPVMSTSRLE